MGHLSRLRRGRRAVRGPAQGHLRKTWFPFSFVFNAAHPPLVMSPNMGQAKSELEFSCLSFLNSWDHKLVHYHTRLSFLLEKRISLFNFFSPSGPYPTHCQSTQLHTLQDVQCSTTDGKNLEKRGLTSHTGAASYNTPSSVFKRKHVCADKGFINTMVIAKSREKRQVGQQLQRSLLI